MSYNAPAAGLVMDKVKRHLTILIIPLLVPLFVCFIVWIAGSAFGSGWDVAPGVFYGIRPITSAPADNQLLTIKFLRE